MNGRQAVPLMMSTLLLICMLTLSLNIKLAEAEPGCVVVTVLFSDGYPVEGATVITLNTGMTYMGVTNASGQVERSGLLDPDDYVARAYYPDDLTLFGQSFLSVNETGDGSTTISGAYEITPPVIEIQSPQNTTYKNNSVQLSFTVDDFSPISWMGYSLDSGGNVTIAGNTTLPDLTEGSHNVIVYARDTMGNEGLDTVDFAVSLPVHNINTGLNYTTIQEAIDATETLDGHTIRVDAGTYHESITVYKQLELLGENHSNTVIDGSGFGTAVNITTSYVTIGNFTVTANDPPPQVGTVGVEINWDRAVVADCKITNFYTGILINEGYVRNEVRNSLISNNARGVRIADWAIRNFIVGNFIINNSLVGVYILDFSDVNEIFNNFLDNPNYNAYDRSLYDNFWNTEYNCTSEPNTVNGPCLGGNYWSDYSGADLYCGSYQNETGSDGIGDTPYVIPGGSGNQDNYPLVSLPVHNINTGLDYPTIQWAIDAPETLDDHKILVDTGTYFENLTVHKRLWLEGEDPSNTVINGSDFETAIYATAESVYIVNFTIVGNGSGIGVRLANHDGIVYNSDIRNFYDGIVIDAGAISCVIRLSKIHNNNFRAVVIGYGSGDFTQYTHIKENFIYDNENGVVVSWAKYTEVYDNFIDNRAVNGYDDGVIPNYWNKGYSSGPNIIGGPYRGGNYWSDYTGEDLYSGPFQNETGSDGIGDTPHLIWIDAEAYDYLPLVSPYDIAIADLTAPKTVVCQGFPVTIEVESENLGLYTETFDVTVYANSSVIGTEEVTLDSKNSVVTLFTWDTTGFDLGNYTISAYAIPIAGELRTDDNNFTDSAVKVTIPGDVNGDGAVNIFDLST
ncbi:MAG: NosD domain-containing protein, partial [Candidatus Hodarchaeota archaeon]